jgi:two-component system, response regulator
MAETKDVDILLAEDADTDAEMIIRALKKMNGPTTYARVRDGVEALEFMFREGSFSARTSAHPKLVLLDLKMPRLGGLDVLRRLKTEDATKTVPVVMLTSSAEERDIVASYRCGANSYLVKPVNFASFTDVVSQAGWYWSAINRVPS